MPEELALSKLNTFLDHFRCIVTKEIMRMPVRLNCPSEHRIEATAANQIIESENPQCPLCQAKITDSKPDRNFKYIIETTKALIQITEEFEKANDRSTLLRRYRTAENNFFESLQCPITHEYFLRPIRVDCGSEHLFEEKMVLQNLERHAQNHMTCTKCTKKINEYTLEPSIKNIIDKFLEIFPKYAEERYSENLYLAPIPQPISVSIEPLHSTNLRSLWSSQPNNPIALSQQLPERSIEDTDNFVELPNPTFDSIAKKTAGTGAAIAALGVATWLLTSYPIIPFIATICFSLAPIALPLIGIGISMILMAGCYYLETRYNLFSSLHHEGSYYPVVAPFMLL